jgi:hypothetical protein
VDQEFADIALFVGHVLGFLSTSIAVVLDLLDDGEEDVLGTVIRINQQAGSTLDVELEKTRTTFIKERSIVRSTTSITTITFWLLESKGMVWMQIVVYLIR